MPTQVKSNLPPRIRKLVDDINEQTSLVCKLDTNTREALVDQYKIAAEVYKQYHPVHLKLKLAIIDCVDYAGSNAVDKYHWLRARKEEILIPLDNELGEIVMKECDKTRNGNLIKVVDTDALVDQYDKSKEEIAKILNQFINEKTYPNSADFAEDMRETHKKQFDQLGEMVDKTCDLRDKVGALKNEMLKGMKGQGQLVTSLCTLIAKLAKNLSPQEWETSKQQFEQLKVVESKQTEDKAKIVEDQYNAFKQAAPVTLSPLTVKWDRLEEKAVGPQDSPPRQFVLAESTSKESSDSDSENSKKGSPSKTPPVIAKNAVSVTSVGSFKPAVNPQQPQQAPTHQPPVEAACSCVMM
jgi:hypothetical protein